jgi:predicted metal-binding membrane protein
MRAEALSAFGALASWVERRSTGHLVARLFPTMLAAVAWGWLLVIPRLSTTAALCGHDQRLIWSSAHLIETMGMWSAMSVAMMGPTAALHALHTTGALPEPSPNGGRAGQGARPYAGYVAAWLGFNLAMTVAQSGLEAANLLSRTMALNSPTLAGGLLLAAGLLGLMRLDGVRTPKCGVQGTSWTRRPADPATVGAHNVMVCGPFMVLAFVWGVMSLSGMMAMTLYMLAEATLQRIGAARTLRGVKRVTSLSFFIGGLVLISNPASFEGLRQVLP